MRPNQTTQNNQPDEQVQTFVNAWDKSQSEVYHDKWDPTVERMYAIYMENVSDINRLKALLSQLVGAVQEREVRW